MKYSNGTITQCYICISLSDLVSCAFSTIPICPFLIQRIFHSLVYLLLYLNVCVSSNPPDWDTCACLTLCLICMNDHDQPTELYVYLHSSVSRTLALLCHSALSS